VRQQLAISPQLNQPQLLPQALRPLRKVLHQLPLPSKVSRKVLQTQPKQLPHKQVQRQQPPKMKRLMLPVRPLVKKQARRQAPPLLLTRLVKPRRTLRVRQLTRLRKPVLLRIQQQLLPARQTRWLVSTLVTIQWPLWPVQLKQLLTPLPVRMLLHQRQ
jgi:hypothetical protein